MSVGSVFVAVLIVASLSTISQAACIYGGGTCIQSCPPGTISYVSPCGTGLTMSQRTCRSPVARSMGMICDLSRCDCPEPRVWDEDAEKCVMLNECT